MSGMITTDLIAAARVNLREGTASIWSDADMIAWCADVVRDISRHAGLLKRANLSIVEYTKEIDLGSLAYIDIADIEYPIGNEPYQPVYRGYKKFGSTVILDLDDIPTITDGTLTGTVTWVPGSRAVSGSSTLFTTELNEGDLIQVGKTGDAAYKWYQVAHITSNTALVLVEPFEESTTADTVNVTRYRDHHSCARIYYSSEYTSSTASSDMPAKYDQLAILGITAYAAVAYATDKAQTKLTDIDTDLASARTVIDTVNVGGDTAGKYAALAQQENSTPQLIAAYKNWADRTWADYQNQLRKIGEIKTFNSYNPRGL